MYGSVTGNSRAIGHLLHEHFSQQGQLSETDSLYKFDASELDTETPYIFIISTWSKGTINESTIDFYNSLPGVQLHDMKYGIIGLGEKKYGEEYFCKAVDTLHERLQQTGAVQVVDPLLIEQVENLQEVGVAQWGDRFILKI